MTRRKLEAVLRPVSEAGAVAFFLVLTSWYWKVNEHVIFLFVLMLSVGWLRDRKPGLVLKGAPGVTLAFYVSLLVWIIFSTLWSESFSLSVSYALLVGIIGLAAITVGAVVGLKRSIQGVFLGTLLLVSHSVYVALGDEKTGFPKTEIGLFTNRSDFSFYIALGLVSLVFLFAPRIPNLIWWIPLVITYSMLVVTVDILTAIFAIAGALTVAGIIFHLRNATPRQKVLAAWGYPAAALLLSVIAWIYRGPLLRPFGEDSTLSGRTEHWANYFEVLTWRPILGMGWGSSPGTGAMSPDISYPVMNFFPAHNGFIDFGIMTGGMGVLLLVGTLVNLFFVGVSRTIGNNALTLYSYLPALVVYLSLNDMMATSLPRFSGVFILGLMVGAVLNGAAPTRLVSSERPRSA